MLLLQGCRHLFRLEGLIGWRSIDEGGDPYLLVWIQDIFAVEKCAGPILDGFVVTNLGVPASLAAVKSNAAACCQLPASNIFPAAQEAIFEVFYHRNYT